MSTFKRILAWTLIVISVIGILVCTLGVVGSWMIKDRLTQEVLGLLSKADTAVTRVEDSLTLVDAQLKDAGTAIDTVREAASKLGDRIEKNSPVLDRISQILNEELGPTVNKIRDTFLKIEERVSAVNNTIAVVNALPGIELPPLDIQFEGINDRVSQVFDTVQQLQKSIADFKAGIVQSMAPFLERLDRISGFLVKLDQDMSTYLDKVNKLQAVLAGAKANIPATINKITIFISIIFLWVILAQIGLVLVARFYLRTGRMVWEFDAPRKSQEVVPEAAS
jgi:hypothetical protein